MQYQHAMNELVRVQLENAAEWNQRHADILYDKADAIERNHRICHLESAQNRVKDFVKTAKRLELQSFRLFCMAYQLRYAVR